MAEAASIILNIDQRSSQVSNPPEKTSVDNHNILHESYEISSLTARRDAWGYMYPVIAYKWLLSPSVKRSTYHLERLLFPSEQRARSTVEKWFECQLRGSIAPNGAAIWNHSGRACRHVLKTIDSYRRHIIQHHLGCRRQRGKRQDEVIGT